MIGYFNFQRLWLPLDLIAKSWPGHPNRIHNHVWVNVSRYVGLVVSALHTCNPSGLAIVSSRKSSTPVYWCSCWAVLPEILRLSKLSLWLSPGLGCATRDTANGNTNFWKLDPESSFIPHSKSVLDGLHSESQENQMNLVEHGWLHGPTDG